MEGNHNQPPFNALPGSPSDISHFSLTVALFVSEWRIDKIVTNKMAAFI